MNKKLLNLLERLQYYKLVNSNTIKLNEQFDSIASFCTLVIIFKNTPHYCKVIGFTVEVHPSKELEIDINVINHTLAVGHATLTVNKNNINELELYILEDTPSLQVLYGR